MSFADTDPEIDVSLSLADYEAMRAEISRRSAPTPRLIEAARRYRRAIADGRLAVIDDGDFLDDWLAIAQPPARSSD